MPYEFMATTTAFEAEIRTSTDPTRDDFFDSKGRALARAQAIGALEAHGQRFGFGGTGALLAKIRAAEKHHAAAVEANNDRERHVEELVSALYGYALAAHRNRWLTWWAVATATVGVAATLFPLAIKLCRHCCAL